MGKRPGLVGSLPCCACWHCRKPSQHIWSPPRAVLPAPACMQLLTERSICHRLVPTPGTGAPLNDLHTGLDLLQ